MLKPVFLIDSLAAVVMSRYGDQLLEETGTQGALLTCHHLLAPAQGRRSFVSSLALTKYEKSPVGGGSPWQAVGTALFPAAPAPNPQDRGALWENWELRVGFPAPALSEQTKAKAKTKSL